MKIYLDYSIKLVYNFEKGVVQKSNKPLGGTMMDYRETYFELFRRQADTIDALEAMVEQLRSVVDNLKIGHVTAEAILLNQEGKK